MARYSFSEKIVIALGIVVIVCLLSLLLAWPFMLLWNWLMPLIFGLVKITFWQSVGLLILSGMLFRNGNSSSN